MNNWIRSLLILSVSSTITLPAELTVGTANSTSGRPFTGNYIVPTRYQQIYASSAFPGAVSIAAISFMHDPQGPYPIGDVIDEGTYIISFSTTPSLVNGLTPQFNSNIGSPLQSFVTTTLNNTLYNVPNPLVFTGTNPYIYDPAQGNLLLDIQVIDGFFPGSSRSTGYVFRADNSGQVTSRALYQPSSTPGGYLVDGTGLVTTFTLDPAPAPEPQSVFLLSGALLTGLIRRYWRLYKS